MDSDVRVCRGHAVFTNEWSETGTNPSFPALELWKMTGSNVVPFQEKNLALFFSPSLLTFLITRELVATFSLLIISDYK